MIFATVYFTWLGLYRAAEFFCGYIFIEHLLHVAVIQIPGDAQCQYRRDQGRRQYEDYVVCHRTRLLTFCVDSRPGTADFQQHHNE